MQNPFAEFPVTGTWADHASYSAGGTDYPTPYGFEIYAPAAGTLRISGGTGEFQCGWVGSAGRRSILMLDTPAVRVIPAEQSPAEVGDVMVAIVFQHQARFGIDGKHYDEGEAGLGWTGASANGDDYGGDTHVHIHGLTADGRRVRVESFANPHTIGDEQMAYIRTAQHGIYTAAPGVVIAHTDNSVVNGIEYRRWGVVMDIAADDLPKFLFALAGCQKHEIPAPGYVWYGNRPAGSSLTPDQITAAVEDAIQGDYQVVKK